MDDLVAAISDNTGIDPGVARRGAAIILKFLRSEGPQDKVQMLIDAIPGAAEAADSAPDVSGGVMGVFNALTGAGLGMGDIQGVTREFVAYAKSKVGSDSVDAVIGAIPGLAQFV